MVLLSLWQIMMADSTYQVLTVIRYLVRGNYLLLQVPGMYAHCKMANRGKLYLRYISARNPPTGNTGIIKIKIHSSCEIECIVETHLCKLCVILRSRVLLRVVCPH